MSDLKPNFGKAAEDYARYRAGFPDSIFDRLQPFGVGTPGQRVVDLGTGTGTLARGFARRGCAVTGIDPDAAMLEKARELDREAGVSVDYRESQAEQTGLAAGSVDVVSAGQCWHWFDRDEAAREAQRILARGGRILIAHFDWLPLAGSVVEATERLIELHNRAWKYAGGIGIHPAWLSDLARAGFREIESFSYDLDVPYTPEAWRGRIRASAGVGASLAPDQVECFDHELRALLAREFPGEVLAVPHRVFAVVARSAESAA